MVMPPLVFELGQKFSFPVKAVKESNTGGRCWWCRAHPCATALGQQNSQTFWGCRHHSRLGEYGCTNCSALGMPSFAWIG